MAVLILRCRRGDSREEGNVKTTSPMKRSTWRCARSATASAALFLGVALALPVQAERGHGHHRSGGPGDWIERHADELGLDEATRAEISRIVEASRAEREAIREEHRRARDAMHELLEKDGPDRAAVMKQADVMGEIEVRKHKQRLATMLEILTKLTPEQRSKLRALKDDMREKHHGKRGRHHRCDEGDGEAEELPPPSD
jgi:Spy/CpxP family protein refolding chaperone